MTVLTRWEPFREFASLQDRINRVFRDSYSGAGQDESLTTSSFAPGRVVPIPTLPSPPKGFTMTLFLPAGPELTEHCAMQKISSNCESGSAPPSLRRPGRLLPGKRSSSNPPTMRLPARVWMASSPVGIPAQNACSAIPHRRPSASRWPC